MPLSLILLWLWLWYVVGFSGSMTVMVLEIVPKGKQITWGHVGLSLLLAWLGILMWFFALICCIGLLFEGKLPGSKWWNTPIRRKNDV